MGPASDIANSGGDNLVFSRLHRQAVAVLLVIFSLLCCSAAVAEKNWSINPGIQLSETYSDNVDPGSGEGNESDFVTKINPVLQAELNGNRIQAYLDYRMQNIFYARRNENTTYHQYLALASAEILSEHFFVDASSSQIQRNISSDGVRARENYIITDDRTNQLTASIRPSWYQSIGPNAEALLDYEHGIVKYNDNGVLTTDSSLDSSSVAIYDSILDSASLAIYSLAGEQRLSWKINTQGQNIVYDDNAIDDVKLRNTGLLLGYRITPSVSSLAFTGYEDNDFGDRLTTTDPKGAIWALGFSWRPNARTELEALAGDRFFGNTYRVEWRQRARYFRSELSYNEAINGEVTSALEKVSLIDSPYGYSNSSLSLTGNVFLSKILRASASFEKSRTLITITPYYEKREFEISAEDETVSGITGNWRWAFAPRTTFTLTMHRDKTDKSGGVVDQTFTWSDVQLERRLGKQTTASIKYSYTKSGSADSQDAYTENAITVQLAHFFGTPTRETSALPSRRYQGQL